MSWWASVTANLGIPAISEYKIEATIKLTFIINLQVTQPIINDGHC